MSRNPQSAVDLSCILEDLQAAAAADFEQARPIPPAVNHSPAFLDLERRAVFEREWICVGRDDELPKPGDFLSFEIAGAPMIVVRHDDGSLRAFVNACAHRRACLLGEERGSVRRITCP